MRGTMADATPVTAEPAAPTYECDGCAACCRTRPVLVSEADARREPRIATEGGRLAEHLETPEWVYRLHPLPFHRACCFLGEGDRCTIYASRPTVCREFEPGRPDCQEVRARVGLPRLEPVRL